MSWIFFIKTENRVNFKDVYIKLKYDRSVNAIEVSDTLVYFYGPGLSTRGIDVSLEEYGYEIKITVMSNESDLSLALRIMQIVSEMTGGKIYDEEDNELIGPSYLTEEFIKNSFINDMKLIFKVINDTGNTIEFPGPTRSVFIGKKILNENINYEKRLKTTAKNIESIFYDVLYRYDNWGIEPSIMAVESNEKDRPIKLKLVSADDNYLVQDYDYIIVGDAGERESNDIVLIDQKNLEIIKPKYWSFIDESTIITEKMPEDEWYSFREECRKYNCYNDFQKKTKRK